MLNMAMFLFFFNQFFRVPGFVRALVTNTGRKIVISVCCSYYPSSQKKGGRGDFFFSLELVRISFESCIAQ